MRDSWNDNGANASLYSEAYYAWRDNLPALADKQWGGNLTEAEYDQVFDVLHASIPAQNLDMNIPSKTPTILKYDLDSDVRDTSGNGYDGTNNGCKFNDSSSSIIFDGDCYISTPLTDKGRSYNLSFSIYPTSTSPSSLFSNSDTALQLGNGSITNVTFIGDGHAYSLNYTLPTHQWSQVSVLGLGNQTFLQVDDGLQMEFTTKIGVAGSSFVWARMAFPAPLAEIGQGFKGMMNNIVLTDLS